MNDHRIAGWHEALRRLQAHEPKELACRAYAARDGAACAIGVVLPGTRRYGELCDEAIDVLLARDADLAREARALGMTTMDLRWLQRVNDQATWTEGFDRASRYHHVVAYAERAIGALELGEEVPSP